MSSARPNDAKQTVSAFLPPTRDASNIFDILIKTRTLDFLSLDDLMVMLARSKPGLTNKTLVAEICKRPSHNSRLFTAANDDPRIYRVIRREPSLINQLSEHEQIQLTRLHSPVPGIGRDMM